MKSVNYLDEKGLNLRAVFNYKELPSSVQKCLAQESGEQYSQLLLFAHGGRTLWDALKQSRVNSENPVDDFSVDVIKKYFRENYPDHRIHFLYPGDTPVGLQALGELAGWHNPTPFKVGINQYWGSWFAYRAVVLADTQFSLTDKMQAQSPCINCEAKYCIKSCPGTAMINEEFVLDKCVNYRKQEDSACRDKCISRISCPVGHAHRYSKEQINYHYSVSMKTIEKYY